jgi:hypothetical protein
MGDWRAHAPEAVTPVAAATVVLVVVSAVVVAVVAVSVSDPHAVADTSRPMVARLIAARVRLWRGRVGVVMVVPFVGVTPLAPMQGFDCPDGAVMTTAGR